MKTKQSKNILKRLGILAGLVIAILMIPLLTKMPWTTFDYIFAGVVLSACAIAYEMITKNMQNKKHRLLTVIVILLFIIMVLGWAAAGPPDEATRLISE